MKSLKRTLTLWLILATFSSCIFDKKTEDKEIESFYTTKNFGQFPVLPLSKPLKLHQEDQSKEWKIEYLKHSFKQRIPTQNLKSIGIDKTYIYGKIDKKTHKSNIYSKGEFTFLHKFNSMSSTPNYREPTKDEIQIYPTDSINKTFVFPERWFVINVADSTTEAFFSKKKYEDYLKEKGISGKMYDINKYHKQYKETGILPWFPDSVKVKLKK